MLVDRRAIRDCLPMVPGIFLWAAIFGAAATIAGLPKLGAIAMSAVVWSGTAQLGAIGLLHQPLYTLFGTSLLLSLRFVPMSLVLARQLEAHPRWQRALLCCLVVDNSFALMTKVHQHHARYLATTCAVFYSCWVGGTVVGALAGPLLPVAALSATDAVVGAIFAYLTVELCTNRTNSTLALLGAAGGVAATLFLPPGLAILLVAVTITLVAVALKR